MINIKQIKVEVSKNSDEMIKKGIAKKINIPIYDVESYSIIRQSLDARDKNEIFYVYEVDAKVKNESKILSRNIKDVFPPVSRKYEIIEYGNMPLKKRPVIVGSGPAGLFAAYILAEHGYHPLVIERGEPVDQRIETVENFWKTGKLNENSNVQFGEGGAGTFSDGKLNTLVKDKMNRGRKVFETFVSCGAPKEIIYDYKPHIGTDILRNVVKNLRNKIIEMGGEFHYNACLTNIVIENEKIVQIEINNQKKINTDILVLAIGHSARDTFQMLYEKRIKMEAKPFAVGFRVSHPQVMIDKAQYGEKYGTILSKAPYKLTYTATNHRGVYSFCMCPGGYVVNASSEPGRLAVNGMSYQARDSRNANSAMIVTVTPEDFPDKGVLGGVEFQRNLEKKAWELGKGKIPVQLFGDFCKNQASEALGEVTPCMKGEYILTNVRSVLPKAVGDSIEEGVRAFGKRISGFDREDALLSGIESRTSSPVRIVRNQELTANMAGIYPCGEGAGYAGGITSAAMDGIKVAETVCRKYAAIKNN